MPVLAGTTGYSYSRALTINHAKVPNSDQANFPVLVSVSDSSLKSAGNGGHIQNSSGYDILFTADAAGNTNLAYERESYNAATGQLICWVKLPAVSHTTDTVFYIWYGNSSVGADPSTPAAVWDSNYKIVTHFKELSGSQMGDSTANGNTAYLSGGTTAVNPGAIGQSYRFDGSTGLATINNSASWAAPVSQFVIEFWIRVLDTSSYRGAVTSSTWADSMSLYMRQGNDPGTWAFKMPLSNSPTGRATAASSPLPYMSTPDGQYHHVVVVQDGTAGVTTVYSDGVNVGSSPYSLGITQFGSYNLYLGGFADAVRMNAEIDEFRVSAGTVRTADWIAAEYNNQSSPATFVLVGSESATGQSGGGGGGTGGGGTVTVGAPNNWTAVQTFSAGALFPGNGVWSTSGSVGIGTTNPQYKLAVNGTIGAKEVIVTNTGWADYVLQAGYRLMPLTEIHAYITANGHLPGIPSETEVKQNGIGLGEMQAKLLAKIEELTLHVIQQAEENRELRARIEQLEGEKAPSPALTQLQSAKPRAPSRSTHQ